MDQCIFCKIISGELPSSRVYEDEHMVAFLDIYPIAPGHTLLVPKIHCNGFLDCTPEALSAMTLAAQKVARAVVAATGASACNIGINNGKAAGQIVFHLHMHIIPRREDDGLRPWGHGEYREGEMAAIAEKIRTQL